jgi:putative membrane protein
MLAAITAQVCENCVDHMGGGWWWVMGVGWLVFLAAIVVLAVVLVRQYRGPATSGRSAHDVLDERFARGEIDEEEYRRRRDALQR